jgi:hypothetical protein
LSEIVNLRLARKRKAREEAERHAVERRSHFGRTKGEKQGQAQLRELQERSLEGHRLTTRDEP